MKRFIETVFPAKLLEAARDVRERMRLMGVPQCHFDVEKLGLFRDLQSPTHLFADADAEKLWRAAEAEISSVFGTNQNTFAVNPGDRRALFYLVWFLKPKRVLEVGTHVGGSTLHIALALRKIAQNAKVMTVDIVDVNDPSTGPWRKFGLPMAPVTCAEQLGCKQLVEFRAAPALEFMAETGDRFDLIFLDGDHSAPAVYREVSAALRILNEGGVILLHDFYPEARALFPDGVVISGPYRALERIRRENQAIEVHPLGALPWETKQGTHVTSLALVARRA